MSSIRGLGTTGDVVPSRLAYAEHMKRLKLGAPVMPVESRRVPPPNLAARADWNGMTIPAVPPADWPASLLLDHAIDRIVRETFSSGRSLHEAVTRITEFASTIVPQITEEEIDRRVHAQALANT
jgi:hypothetical protein